MFDLRTLSVGRFARLADGVDEPIASQQRPVELFREDTGGVVVHRPSGGDDAAHADLDQRSRDARRKAGAVEAVIEQLISVAAGEMAAVHEHQLGNHPHVADLVGSEKAAVRQHDAARLALFGQRSVPRDVHDPPRPLEQGVDYRSRVRADLRRILADERRHERPVQRAGPRETGVHGHGLAARAVQPRVLLGAFRLADHERARVGVGVGHVFAESLDAQLAEQLDADGPRPLVGVVIVVGVEQFPRNPAVAGSSSICISPLPARYASSSTGISRLNSVRPIC